MLEVLASSPMGEELCRGVVSVGFWIVAEGEGNPPMNKEVLETTVEWANTGIRSTLVYGGV